MDRFLASYIETALWSSENGGEPLDSSGHELSTECLECFQKDCGAFQKNTAHLDLSKYRLEQIAHDFWLTRNGHGAGFWDGDYPEDLGDALTKIARIFGECDLYVGDDGLIYC